MTAAPGTGFLVRPARPDEGRAVEALLAAALGGPVGLGAGVAYLAAFAAAGGDLLGGLAARRAAAADGTTFAFFRVGVLPEHRRRGVGTGLVTSLYRAAAASDLVRLTLAELVHRDRPGNAFCRRLGLGPERSLVTFASTAAELMAATAAFAARAGGLDLVSTAEVDPDAVAALVTATYGGFPDRWAADLRAGVYDPRVSVAAVRGGRVAAVGLTRADTRSLHVELVAVHPDDRHGPAAAAVCNAIARRAAAAGIFDGVWEADPEHDRFAANLARRAGAKPVGVRHRYAIDAAGVRAWLAAR